MDLQYFTSFHYKNYEKTHDSLDSLDSSTINPNTSTPEEFLCLEPSKQNKEKAGKRQNSPLFLLILLSFVRMFISEQKTTAPELIYSE